MSATPSEITRAAKDAGVTEGEPLVAFTQGFQASLTQSSSILEGSTLTYFDLPARGDTARIMLTLAGVKFTDERVQFKQWGQLKGKTPWGSLPYLTLANGTVLGQSTAVNRFIGKLTGLYPTDPVAAALVDQVIEGIHDVFPVTMKVGPGLEGQAKVDARRQACKDGAIAATTQRVENAIAKFGSGGYAVGNSLTVADIFIFVIAVSYISGVFDGVPQDHFDRFPNIQAVRKTVASHKGVRSYYAPRMASNPDKLINKVIQDLTK